MVSLNGDGNLVNGLQWGTKCGLTPELRSRPLLGPSASSQSGAEFLPPLWNRCSPSFLGYFMVPVRGPCFSLFRSVEPPLLLLLALLLLLVVAEEKKIRLLEGVSYFLFVDLIF